VTAQTIAFFQTELDRLGENHSTITVQTTPHTTARPSTGSSGAGSSSSSSSSPSPFTPSSAPLVSAPSEVTPPGQATKKGTQDLRCWDTCCKGRRFSNKSNMIRHRRERSGQMGNFRCSFCNAYFSRGSARNMHEANRICRMPQGRHAS
jgi:hypothetical protein